MGTSSQTANFMMAGKERIDDGGWLDFARPQNELSRKSRRSLDVFPTDDLAIPYSISSSIPSKPIKKDFPLSYVPTSATPMLIFGTGGYECIATANSSNRLRVSDRVDHTLKAMKPIDRHLHVNEVDRNDKGLGLREQSCVNQQQQLTDDSENAKCWCCSFCHLEFSSYQEAYYHELECDVFRQQFIQHSSKDKLSCAIGRTKVWRCSKCHCEFQHFEEADEHEQKCALTSCPLSQNYHFTQQEASVNNDALVATNTFRRKVWKSTNDNTYEYLNMKACPHEDIGQAYDTNLMHDEVNFLSSISITTGKELLRFLCTESRVVLGSMYSTWRAQMGLPKLSDATVQQSIQTWYHSALEHSQTSLSMIENKSNIRRIFRQNNISCIEHRQKRVQDHELMAMEAVDCLCYTVQRCGYPVCTKSVIDPFTDMLYDFEIDVRPSLIQGAGQGAFLTYLGARTLKPEAKKWSDLFKANRFGINAPTREELIAVMPDKSNAIVTLAGKNLHGNYNSSYFPITRLPLLANIPNGRSDVKVTLQGLHLHEDIDFLKEVGLVPTFNHGIGWLGAFTEADYDNDDSIPFSSYGKGCGLIHLGRYGPFMKTDRKSSFEFNLKDFIFSSEPAVWSFGVGLDEELIDITDDATGLPTTVAKENIAMYVNEVGHDENLMPTVLALEKDNGSVHYYIKVNTPMKKGEAVELLVSYADSYEETRERKGYGKANMRGILSDTDTAERISRNISDRIWLERGVSSTNLLEMKQILAFIRFRMLEPVVSATNRFLNHLDGSIMGLSPITTRQLIARRRIHWLGDVFRDHFCSISMNLSEIEEKEIRCNIEIMQWPWSSKLLGLLSSAGITDILVPEFLEENVYSMYKTYGIAHVYDKSLYCRISRDLTTSVLTKIITSSMQDIPEDLTPWIYRMVKRVTNNLRERIGSIGKRNQCPPEVIELVSSIDFRSSVRVNSIPVFLFKHDYNHVEITENSAFDSSFLVVRNGRNHNRPFIFVLDTITKASLEECEVNEEWYVMSQVVNVVHMIVSKFIETDDKSHLVRMFRTYSYQNLCQSAAVDSERADALFNLAVACPLHLNNCFTKTHTRSH